MKKKKSLATFQNVVLFPGTVERLIARAHEYVKQEQYELANQSFEEALLYIDGDEMTLSVYAYSLYETKDYEKAKNVCEDLLSIGPSRYLEIMKLYLTICMQLKQFEKVENTIATLLEEGAIPKEQVYQFQKLQELNANIKETYQFKHEEFHQSKEDVSQSNNEMDRLKGGNSPIKDETFNLDYFASLSPIEQINQIRLLHQINIRPLTNQLKKIVEDDQTHPFIQSMILILFVEQQIDVEIEIKKFQKQMKLNPNTFELPTELPQYNAIVQKVEEQLEHDPTLLKMVLHLISKHAIVTYPFEWLDYDTISIATGYIEYAQFMLGREDISDKEIFEFLQYLEKITELQEV